jgi:hexosaminidase
MKTLLIVFFVFLSVVVFAQHKAVQLIPRPALFRQAEGQLRVTPTSSISFNNEEIKSIAENLSQKLGRSTGFNLKSIPGKTGTIQLHLMTTTDQKLANEGYEIVSGSKNLIIKANNPAGIFYGVQTLLQLLPAEIESKTAVKADWIIPAVEITDYPRFGWRGIMLDVSRHFFSKEDVKRYIDQIVRYKYNTLHLHLTDDNGWRIEIKSMPKLTEVGAWRVQRAGHFGERSDPKPAEPATYGGFYSQDEIRELVKYAADRFVTIVPEIDLPGHSMAMIAAYPELSCRKNPDTKVNPGTNFAEWYGNGTFKMLIENTLNPSDEKVYEVLDKIFTEVASLFPNQYIHVGGDECYKGYWAQDEGCQALMKKLNIRHVEDLQGYFMNRVEQILKTKGKRLLGWDEILEGGISPDATVMSWRGVKGGIEAARMGHDVVMTPTTYTYLDYQQGEQTIEPPIYASLRLKKCYSFDPVPAGVDPKYILGGQGNLWTEQIPNLRYAEYMTWPRGWALAEDFWSPTDGKNWDNFIQRVESHITRSDAAEINCSRAIYDPLITFSLKNGSTIMEIEIEAPGLEVFYTFDDTMPDQFSPKYSQPVEIPSGPVTVRIISYRSGKPIGHLITINPADIKKRTKD